MSRKITQYAQEFKKSSAELAVSSAKSLSETARDLGIKPSTLHGWVVRYFPDGSTKNPQEQAINAEIMKLRRENSRLRQERDILKKAAAYFAKEV